MSKIEYLWINSWTMNNRVCLLSKQLRSGTQRKEIWKIKRAIFWFCIISRQTSLELTFAHVAYHERLSISTFSLSISVPIRMQCCKFRVCVMNIWYVGIWINWWSNGSAVLNQIVFSNELIIYYIAILPETGYQ